MTNCLIRDAEEDDVEAIVAMSEKFYATTYYTEFAPFDADSCSHIILGLITAGTLLVAEVEGKLVGMIGVVVHPFLFNVNVVQASEIVWWLDPDYRKTNTAKMLMQAMENRAKEQYVDLMLMINLDNSPPAAKVLYTNLGYKNTENAWTKVLE